MGSSFYLCKHVCLHLSFRLRSNILRLCVCFHANQHFTRMSRTHYIETVFFIKHTSTIFFSLNLVILLLVFSCWFNAQCWQSFIRKFQVNVQIKSRKKSACNVKRCVLVIEMCVINTHTRTHSHLFSDCEKNTDKLIDVR